MLTVAHPFNPAKLLWHRDKLAAIAANGWPQGPISVEWDFSNTCGHACPFCSFGTHESQGYRQQHLVHFPLPRALDLVRELKAAGVESITITGGGEPLNHPHAPRIVAAIIDAGIPFGLVTNGQLLRGPVARLLAQSATFVRVSWDAGTAATHQRMHRTPLPQLDLIEDQMRYLIGESRICGRTTPLVVGASFCVTDDNVLELPIAAERLDAIGASYLEVRPTYPTTWRGDGWNAALTRTDDARDSLLAAKMRVADRPLQIIGMTDRFAALEGYAKGYTRCGIGPITTVIAATGTLYHCCVQRGRDDFALANVLQQSFADAWAEAGRKQLADTINVDKCPRCRYDDLNRILEALPSDPFHAAFI